MTERELLALVAQRVMDVEDRLKVELGVTFDFGDYAHFRTPRGYGVTFFNDGHCHMRFSRKALRCDPARFDGVVRHELGHVVDMLYPAQLVNLWCAFQGVTPAATPELRADDIAHAIWGEPLRYDKLTVQNTRVGRVGRPSHLPQ